MVDEVHAHMKEMLEVDTIHHSQSPWCNAVVLVCKKDGGLWFCTGFCKLNARTKKDSYLLLRIQETIESLVSAEHFSCLDLKAGFWEISMDKVLKQYTTFTEWKHMPFGLCNAQATFQKLMQNCLGKLNMTYCLLYLDDIIVFLMTEEEHLHCLYVVFEHFREHHLKLKPTKCRLFKSKINYLAHHVSKECIQPSREDLKAMADFTPSQIYMEIWAFLGLVGLYRQFITGFACIVQPLHEHLSGEGASLKREQVALMEEVQGAFEMLKGLASRPWCWLLLISISHSFWRPDTSKLGLGAVLSQKQHDDQYHQVAYTIWSLTVHEHNYSPPCHIWTNIWHCFSSWCYLSIKSNQNLTSVTQGQR